MLIQLKVKGMLLACKLLEDKLRKKSISTPPVNIIRTRHPASKRDSLLIQRNAIITNIIAKKSNTFIKPPTM